MNKRIISILSFSFFDAWLLSFAYEGQVLYSLYELYSINTGHLIMVAILSHALGLFICGYIVKSFQAAKHIMMMASGLCVVGSAVFFFLPSIVWAISLITMSFFAGLWNAAWGWSLAYSSNHIQRIGTVAASIAIGTSLMVGLNMTAIHIVPQLGLALAILCLFASLYFIAKLPLDLSGRNAGDDQRLPQSSVRGSLVLLCLFIVVITINAGLMFAVINPAFAHLTVLTSWYWAVPYILTIVLVALLPQKVKRSHLLYISITMQGFGFIAFLLLDRSSGSYFIVNTLLLGAFGINDLFWWSILGEMLDFAKNPAKLFGLGLSVNVGGVLLGEIVSSLIPTSSGEAPTMVGLSVVCVTFVILPILYKRLSNTLKDSVFLTEMAEVIQLAQSQTSEIVVFSDELSGRENQVVALLLCGYTYELISKELFISKSTVRTHVQNIYYKLGIHNRSELIQKLKK